MRTHKESSMAKHDTTKHTGRTIALVGGGAILLWLLFRGKGSGLGSGGDGPGPAAGETPKLRVPCRVFIRAGRIDLDGVPADLPTVVTRCRAGAGADVRSTGGASVQAIEDVIHALQQAKVPITASPD